MFKYKKYIIDCNGEKKNNTQSANQVSDSGSCEPFILKHGAF